MQQFDFCYDEKRIWSDFQTFVFGLVTSVWVFLSRGSSVCLQQTASRSITSVSHMNVCCVFLLQGGPYHDLLHSVLGAYTCYRPDIGYVSKSIMAALTKYLKIIQCLVKTDPKPKRLWTFRCRVCPSSLLCSSSTWRRPRPSSPLPTCSINPVRWPSSESTMNWYAVFVIFHKREEGKLRNLLKNSELVCE